MKSNSPSSLALYVAATSSVIITLFLLLSLWLLETAMPWQLPVIVLLISFFTIFFLFRFTVNRFIYDKIKLVYKTIHQLKLGQKKNLRKKLEEGENVIDDVNREVVEWAADKTKEIDNLKKMEAYRREFIGNLAHELKTPIFNIQGYITTLLDDDEAEEDLGPEEKMRVRYLRNAEKNVERMINLVHDLDTVSRLESGDMPLVMEKFDIVELATDVIDMLEKRAADKQVLLQLRENYGPIYVMADQNTIRQVFTNLLVNSIIYGNEHGNTKISFFDMHENILIEVADNGPGITEEHLPRLFERFYRVDKSRSRNMGGTGLGLAIVKHIIEAHRQTINVRSAVGKGATFSFTLKKAR
ncbi:MAG: sensor histidine kinase [Flavobacteriales bacterium]